MEKTTLSKLSKVTDSEPEKAVIAGLCAQSMNPAERSDDESLDELEALLQAAGGVCVAKAMQNLKTPDPRTFIGSGKVKELKELVEAHECTLAVFDNELSPSQAKCLMDELDIRVIDRSSLILDIFADRARTKEGRLQVELAQYNYLLPRLQGMWKHLVRQTGSSAPIGTRGPGETQLETDRRHIRRRIQKLEEELRDVIKVRDTQRRLRVKNTIPVVALVGYTNAGKSTLLNKLTDAGIQAENRLFDTLDTTTRRLKVSDTTEVLISDTVGFIRKLPHHLVDAFKATLEELKYADLLLHVIDASSAASAMQARIVHDMINGLGIGETPCIEIYNKCDIVTDDILPRGENTVQLSAKTGEGTGALLGKILRVLSEKNSIMRLKIPYDKAGIIETLYREGAVAGTRYLEDYIELDARVKPDLYGRLKQFE